MEAIYKNIKLKLDNKIRLDILLLNHFPEYTRTFINKSIRTYGVFVNNEEKFAPGFSLFGKVELIIDWKVENQKKNINLEEVNWSDIFVKDIDIFYDDESFFVINKPKNIIVYDPNQRELKTIYNYFRYFKKMSLASVCGEGREGIVHRLDKDTTGLLIISKTNEAAEKFLSYFKNRKIQKKYYLIAQGHFKKNKSMTINLPIIAAKNWFSKKIVAPEGKKSVTHFTNLEEISKTLTLLEAEIITGTTHQIRVHLKAINCPIFADKLYNHLYNQNIELIEDPNYHSQFLHAYYLKFHHPLNNQVIKIKTPLPDYFISLIKKLKKKV